MHADLLADFGIKKATDELCRLADLPPIDWDAPLNDKQLDEMNEYLSKK